MSEYVPITPTAEQKDAIEHPLTPLLIVAGAGTGKTTVMAERMIHALDHDLATPDQLLGLTFTNKAAAELKRRVQERARQQGDITVATYHGFAAGLVMSHALQLDLDPRTELLNRAQAWQLLFAVFDEFRFHQRKTFKPSLIVSDALVLASRCADHLVDIDAVYRDAVTTAERGRWNDQRDKAAGRAELCQVVAAYERRKRERNLIDYGDQIRLAVRLLDEHREIAEGLHEQFPVVLLDEYQDTNYAQRRLLELIYPPGSAITAVGDDMQSIYAFRGAHLENIRHFDVHFPPVERRPLTVNRRSGEAVVGLANRIQANVPGALEKELQALPDAPPTTIECFLAADDAEEAETIADEIATIGAPWSADAVLCRKRRVIPAIVSALEARGIPVEVAGSSGLLQRPEVVDLVAWLEVLADLGATVALLRLLRGPRYRIGVRDLAALARHAEGVGDALADLDAVPDLSAEARTRLEAFVDERRHLSAAASRLPVLDLAETIIERTGLWTSTGERGRENLLRFLDVAERFAPVEGDPGLPAFLEYLQLLEESEEDVAEAHLTGADAVRVMTIHQAKGLEFPHVWVPGLATRVFPDARGGENALSNTSALPWWLRPDDAGMPHWESVKKRSEIDDEVKRRAREEEWRLLYVACTRAQRRLVCSAAQWYPPASTPGGPSAFYDFLAEQTDLVHERFRHDPADIDPKVAAMERRLADAERRAGERAARRRAAEPAPSLFEGVAAAPAVRQAPVALSVTSLVSYARCPRQFYWSVVRPLPRASSAATRIGTEVHRWIEARGGRQLRLVEPVDGERDADADGERGPAGAGVVEGLKTSFLKSPYAELDPERVEAPFVLAVDGRLVRGRIDAVYRRDDRLELVDFKTGLAPAEGDAGADVQLDLYALAAVDAWGADPAELRTTYCYLRVDSGAHLVTREWDRTRVDAVRAALGDQLRGVRDGRYAAVAGAWCARCDFRPFCPAGQVWPG